MILKISLLKCLLLINLTTIQCFNVIMIKNLNENQLVDKLSQIVRVNEDRNNNIGKDHANEIAVRSNQRRTPKHKISDEDKDREDANDENDNLHIEGVKTKVYVQNPDDRKQKIAENKINEESNEISNEKATKRSKHRTSKSTKTKTKTIRHKKDGTAYIDATQNEGGIFKTFWSALRSWFRRSGGASDSRNSYNDNQNLKDTLKRIILLMKAAETAGLQKPKAKKDYLREPRSGEQHDHLPAHILEIISVTTQSPKDPINKPYPFWNYWTYNKEIIQDNCVGDGVVQYGNLCIDKLGR